MWEKRENLWTPSRLFYNFIALTFIQSLINGLYKLRATSFVNGENTRVRRTCTVFSFFPQQSYATRLQHARGLSRVRRVRLCFIVVTGAGVTGV